MLEILREQSSTKGEKEEEAESKLIYMIHKTDNLEAIYGNSTTPASVPASSTAPGS